MRGKTPLMYNLFMLTDNQLKQAISAGEISINPYNDKKIKAGKYDIHLGRYLLIPKQSDAIVDPTNPDTQPEYEKVDLLDDGYVLNPGKFVLGQTLELIGVSSKYGMFLDGTMDPSMMWILMLTSSPSLFAG